MEKFHVAERQDTFILTPKVPRLTGEIVRQIGDKIEESVRLSYKLILIDMSCVIYFDSGFLSMLITSQKKLSPTNRSIAFCCLNENLQKILYQMQFHRIFAVFSSLEEAIEHAGCTPRRMK